MATHSSILAWRFAWTEEPGRLQSMWLQRIRHDWSHLAHMPHSSWEVSGEMTDSQRGALNFVYKLTISLLDPWTGLAWDSFQAVQINLKGLNRFQRLPTQEKHFGVFTSAKLTAYCNKNIIFAMKVFIREPQNNSESLISHSECPKYSKKKNLDIQRNRKMWSLSKRKGSQCNLTSTWLRSWIRTQEF